MVPDLGPFIARLLVVSVLLLEVVLSRTSMTIALFSAVLLAVAMIVPCAEAACSSSGCDEIAPTQPAAVMTQLSSAMPLLGVACALPAEDGARLCGTAPHSSGPVADPLVSRLRI